MGLKALVPGTAAHSRRHHVKYLQRKLRGHDVMLLVEWEDGALTEVPANIRPEWDGWYEGANGLVFAVQGEGVDPVDWYGVPTVKCHAAIGCPFSTEACLAAEADEAGEFRYRSQDGQTTQVVEVTPREDISSDANGSTNGAATDGGVAQVNAENHERVYDLRPPAGSAGWAFGMSEMKQRAPNPISANDLRRAVEYGKESERGSGELLKWLLIGVGVAAFMALLMIGFPWLLGQIGSGGGGGGGLQFGLLLAAVPTQVRDEFRQLIQSIRQNPFEAGLGAARGVTRAVLYGTAIGALLFTLASLSVFWSEYFARHPEAATPEAIRAIRMMFNYSSLAAPAGVMAVLLEYLEAEDLRHAYRRIRGP